MPLLILTFVGGGDNSEFGNTSATIHHADEYIIAKYFKKVGNTPRDYGDLFKKVFSSTVNEVCPNWIKNVMSVIIKILCSS